MRKVKLLALLLAALMVVTAFAGCANTTEIEGEVDGLESRVEALEGAIGNVQGTVDGLKDSVAGIDSSIAGNNDAIKDVADVLAGLKDQIAELEKAPETQAPETQAPETQAPETEKPAGDSDEALRAKANELGFKIGEIQAQLKVDEKHYTDADYVAVLQVVTAAQTAIAAGETVATMEAEYAKLEAELAKFVRVDTKFYNLYLELKGNYTGDEACLIKVDEAVAAYEDAAEHYADKKVTDWDEYGKDENGKKILLSALKAEIDGWENDYELVVDEAERLVAAIENIDLANTDYNTLRTGIGKDYKNWVKDANKLSPALVSLVSNYADYEAALALAEIGDEALDELQYVAVKDWDSDAEVDLFDNYTELKAANKHLIFVQRYDVSGESVLVETADIYADIVAAINAWAAEYELTDAKTIELLINKKFGGSTADAKYFYATFLNEKAFVEDMAAKSEEFKDTLAKNFKALNSKRMINVKEDFVKAYEANTKAVEDWYKACYDAYVKALEAAIAADKIVGNKTKVVAKDLYEGVFEANFNEMVTASGLGRYCKTHKTYVLDATVALDDAHKAATDCAGLVYAGGLDYDSNFVALYDFVEGATMINFLTNTYADAKDLADEINEIVAEWDIDGEKTIWTFLSTVGGYHNKEFETIDGETYTYLRANATVDKTKKTVAAYMALYGKGGDNVGSADLSALIDTAAYKAAIEALKAHLNKIDAATAELNEAYVALLGEGAEAIITTANKGKVATLSGKLDAWKKVAGREDSERVEVIGTKNGHEEYELINIVDSYKALDDNTFKTVIADLESRVNQLNNQIKALKSLYAALDKVNAFSAITADSLVNDAATTLKGSNFAATAIAQGEKDSNKKYDWNLSYITYDLDKHEFVVDEITGIYGTNDTYKEADALAKAVEKFADVYTGNTGFSGVTFSSVESNWDGEMFTVSDLIAIATNLYNKVMVNNFGVKDSALEDAKKNFAGYEFTSIVATVLATIKDVATVTDAEKKAVKTSANLAELKNVLVSIDEKSDIADISFAGYTFLDMQSVNDVFTLEGNDAAIIELLDKAKIEVEVDETTGAIVAVEGVDIAATVIWKN